MSEQSTPGFKPDSKGFFGAYGGQYVPEPVKARLDELNRAMEAAQADPEFQRELDSLNEHFAGRPSPVFHCANLSREGKGAQIWLKREDLNHLGAHKINNTLGQCLLARRMGKKRVIAETGAGQHGVATAASAALMGLECTICMGEVDMERQHLNVVRMQMLVLIFLLGRAVDGKVFSVLAKSMLSAGFGFLLVVGIMEYGGYGCLIILAGLLPQWIFYTAALLFYANSKKRQSRIVGWNSWQDRTRQLAEAGLVTGCVLLGTFVESFVNPAAFAWVLKIFC